MLNLHLTDIYIFRCEKNVFFQFSEDVIQEGEVNDIVDLDKYFAN